MKMWNRAGVFAGILLLVTCLSSCGKTNNVQLENDRAMELQEEEISAQTEANDIELPEKDKVQNEMVMDNNGQIEDMEQTQQNYTYRGDTVLTEDNIKKTVKSFLQIENGVLLARLETLPLTERFFNECIEHLEKFPYVCEEDLDQVREFELKFWGIREDGKCVCLCEFCTSFSQPGAKSRCYYVEMGLENDQIDSMEVTLVKSDSPHF